MHQPPRRSRIYPESARISLLVYGLVLIVIISFVALFIAFLARFVFSSQEATPPVVPPVLWFSTAALLAGSFSLRQALAQVRRERQRRFRIWLNLSLGLGTLFCVLQSLGMAEMLEVHRSQAIHQAGAIAAVVFLVFLHVVHFIAGLIALVYVSWQAHRGRYDHEYHNGVRLAALYWRLLDILWLLMLAMILVAGRL